MKKLYEKNELSFAIVYMILLFFGFMLLPGWMLSFYRYMSCFVSANLLLCVCISLWLKKKGTVRFSAL